MLPYQGKFKGKKVLITGNTGFKGAWLSYWLSQALEANVYGLSNGVLESPNLFECLHLKSETDYRVVDVRNFEDVMRSIQSIQPDFVFHLAAQSLVRTAYEDPKLTVESNTLGTLNMLEALRCSTHPCTAVMITSDKVYDNVEWLWGYRENDRLGGRDPYSASKAAAESLIHTYYHSYFDTEESSVSIAIGRAGNVIGGGDWAKDRIVPDIFRSWSREESVEIRKPEATRPWQHVLEPLSGYLSLAQQLSDRRELSGEAFNFGPAANQDVSVQHLLEEMQRHWNGGKWKASAPGEGNCKEAHLLRLNCDKALNKLSWKPTLFFEETIEMTTDWYSNFYNEKSEIAAFTMNQITNYMNLAVERDQEWIQ